MELLFYYYELGLNATAGRSLASAFLDGSIVKLVIGIAN